MHRSTTAHSPIKDHDQLCASPTPTHLNGSYLKPLTPFTSKTTFSYTSYASFRPIYPPSLFKTILDYHHARFPTPAALLDLGCGHGPVSRALAPHFTSITAIDPSPGMIAQATQQPHPPHLTFRPGTAEDLSFLPDVSVDLAVAGEAAHWFDYSRAWPELARVVRPQGAVAFWGYNDSIVMGYPQLRAVYLRFVYGMGEVVPGIEGMGAFWEEPGRSILKESYVAIMPPEEDWEDVRRVVWNPDGSATGGIEKAQEEALWLRKKMRLGEWEGYVRTYSAYNNWKAKWSGKKSRAEGGEGDVVDAMLDAMLETVPEWKAKGEEWREVEVECAWGTCLLMARRR